MMQFNDNHSEKKHGEGEPDKNQSNQNSKNDRTTPEEKISKQDEIPAEDKKDDKFSPGEPDSYNPDEFATD